MRLHSRSSSAAPQPHPALHATDALELLANDHQEMRDLITHYHELLDSDAPLERRQQAAELLCTLLVVHDAIEDQILYPTARQMPALRDAVDTGMADQAMIRHLVRKLQSLPSDDPSYDARVAELAHWVLAHLVDEEQALFGALRHSGIDLQALGLALGRRQEALLGGEPEGCA